MSTRHKQRERMKKELAKDHAAYVLITCARPEKDGNMQVDLSYEGDPSLVAFLLRGAQSHIEEGEKEEMMIGGQSLP